MCIKLMLAFMLGLMNGYITEGTKNVRITRDERRDKLYAEKVNFDSLNVRFVGNWPFGPSYAVTVDEKRDLAYLGSGGGNLCVGCSGSG